MAHPPCYRGLIPRSTRASVAAKGSSRKAGTKPELLLRRALWSKGLRYRKNRSDLPGAPDIVFPAVQVVVFVDGDFWHGKNWKKRRAKLKQGHNATYWIRKIEYNVARDREKSHKLRAQGWVVLRVWESDVHRDLGKVVRRVKSALDQQKKRNGDLRDVDDSLLQKPGRRLTGRHKKRHIEHARNDPHTARTVP